MAGLQVFGYNSKKRSMRCIHASYAFMQFVTDLRLLFARSFQFLSLLFSFFLHPVPVMILEMKTGK